VGGAILLVSNFTLCGDARKGTRPSFSGAARPDEARKLVESFATLLREAGATVAQGRFGAEMQVLVENDGPVCLLLEA
jgi:D-tyrosyl-tRNA(Tyr) deacylase